MARSSTQPAGTFSWRRRTAIAVVGELTRAALAKRGVSDYQPNIAGMYEGPYRGFRQAIETHWQAYLDGKGTREAAILKILIETAPPKK